MKDIAFIDLEASGLSARSWPIEVGWCFVAGAPEARLIRPAEQWSLDDWSRDAEALHGVAHKTLLKEGGEPKQVCEALLQDALGRRVPQEELGLGAVRAVVDVAGGEAEALNAALADKTVYSDAPDWDGFWLYRLFQAGQVRQRFALHNLGALFDLTPPEKMDALVAEAERVAPRRHRAAPDVLHMRALYELTASQGAATGD